MLESLFNKVAEIFEIQNRLQHTYFPVNIAKFLRTAFFYRTSLVAASEKTWVSEIAHYVIVLLHMYYFNDIRLYLIWILYICLGFNVNLIYIILLSN